MYIYVNAYVYNKKHFIIYSSLNMYTYLIIIQPQFKCMMDAHMYSYYTLFISLYLNIQSTYLYINMLIKWKGLTKA